jgi:hypothetical protein
MVLFIGFNLKAPEPDMVAPAEGAVRP